MDIKKRGQNSFHLLYEVLDYLTTKLIRSKAHAVNDVNASNFTPGGH